MTGCTNVLKDPQKSDLDPDQIILLNWDLNPDQILVSKEDLDPDPILQSDPFSSLKSVYYASSSNSLEVLPVF